MEKIVEKSYIHSSLYTQREESILNGCYEYERSMPFSMYAYHRLLFSHSTKRCISVEAEKPSQNLKSRKKNQNGKSRKTEKPDQNPKNRKAEKPNQKPKTRKHES